MKRILSLVLAVLLLVASLPVTVFADADENRLRIYLPRSTEEPGAAEGA